ncbi:MAG: hypothetical protein ASUL_06368 [Candidatus Aramenus sulfurataquae]|jgi:hypothetical protein|uniref:Uncharacterized protein n=2 Tax=Candidatus Aramenus sulfurataquae TaxID=1326980 RepID=W7KV67_9CREN|nr:MAG: hypothetical protein ASUL_06368 [Candidatus Aramenus sulfurataquae]MCL7343992.1 hypothetical protein [Candidatus Aramenus sulfurataquae]
MVKLINWRLMKLENEINVESKVKEEDADVLILPAGRNKLIEYFKSEDIDTKEKLIIRQVKRGKLVKEAKKLKGEGFSVKVIVVTQSY